MEQENDKKEVENTAEASTKSKSAENKKKTLKAKSKIVKKYQDSETKKGKSTSQVRRRNRKRKNSVSEGNIGSSYNKEQDAKKLKSNEERQQKNTTKEERIEMNEEKIGGSDRSQKKQWTEKRRGGSEKILRNERNKEKRDGTEKSQNENKKEKLGGLIFMCSAKTKPDCFRYRVMGVSMSKKDLVLSVKPGLKLFLYDFDLKLMYGIYRASSFGGMKLEPKAFGGAFPVQVQFSVHEDCYPLSENIFKKAIKENYNERHKFKTELTVKQVRKLMELFRPAAVHSTALPIRSPPTATIRDREVYEGVREPRLHISRETFARDPYANGDARSYPVLSHERDQLIPYGEVASTHRQEIPRGLFLTEKEYRAYGLQGERKNLTPPRHIVPTLDTFQRGHEREHLLIHPDLVHKDNVSEPRESIRVDPLYLTEREYQPYNVGARLELPTSVPPAVATASTAGASALDTYTTDQYYSYYGASSLDRYLPPPRREEVSSGSFYGGRRETYPIETDRVDKLYSTYAADALSDFNQINHHQRPKPEAVPAPVSSRYSFAGPSMYYR